MPTSVRLDGATERKLTVLAQRTGRSKSSLMREALAVLHERLDVPTPTIAEQLGDYLAGGRLGPRITGRRAKQILAEGFGRRKRP